MGKLSEVTAACRHPLAAPLIALRGRVTVVDVKRCCTYLENFGEFFEDQIESADLVVLSRVDSFPDRAPAARALVAGINDRAAVFYWPLDALTGEEILSAACRQVDGHDDHDDHDGHDGHDGHESHDGHDGCDDHDGCECHHPHGHSHRHDAPDVFDVVTVYPPPDLSVNALRDRMARVDGGEFGRVIRAKGVLRVPGGVVNLQFVPGELTMEPSLASGGALCLIGDKLDVDGAWRAV